MSEKKQKGVVPRLRFPEFRDAGPWEVKRLGAALTFQTGFPFSSKFFNEVGVGVRLIRNADLKSDDRRVFYSGPYNQDYIVDNGDILVGMDGDFSPSVWRNGPALLNQRVGRIVAKMGNSLSFLHYSLHPALKLIENRTAQTTVKHLSRSAVEDTVWPISTLPEQQKIAACLSSLDELIQLQAQKLDALKAHKKGLMQQLFPREGETTPRLRFPEFRDAGPWEVKPLGALVTTITPPKKIQTTEYQPTGRFPIIDQSPSDTCGWTDDESALVKTGFPVLIFGDHSCVVKLADSSFAQGADGIKILSTADEIEARFLFQSLLGNPIEQRGYKRHFSTLKEKPIAYPRKETGEQQKIADCLASLDELIAIQAQKLEALKAHKKGLMQQLFPQEVSA